MPAQAASSHASITPHHTPASWTHVSLHECIMHVFICCPYGYLRLFPSSITQRARWSPMNHVLHFVYVCVCKETLKVKLRLSAYVTRVVLTHTHRAGGECAESDCTHARTETCVALSTTVLHQRLRLERAQVWGHQFTALIHCKGPIPNHGDEALTNRTHPPNAAAAQHCALPVSQLLLHCFLSTGKAELLDWLSNVKAQIFL